MMQVLKGKEAFHKFFGKSAIGYRSPLGIISYEDYDILANNGFNFDSSIFPSFRFGVFNNLGKPTKPFIINNCKIVEFPFAVVSNIIRVPISLSYLKLLGRSYINFLKLYPIPNLIVFGFHMHDLFELSTASKIPIRKYPMIYRRIFNKIYRGRNSGLSILKEFVRILRKKNYYFSNLQKVYEGISVQER